MKAVGAQVVQQDDYGRLWRTEREIDGEPFVAVEVVNATARAGRLVPALLPARPSEHEERETCRRLDVRSHAARLRAGGSVMSEIAESLSERVADIAVERDVTEASDISQAATLPSTGGSERPG